MPNHPILFWNRTASEGEGRGELAEKAHGALADPLLPEKSSRMIR